MIDTLFTLTRVGEIRASVRVLNPAARRVLEKCGFVAAGSSLELLPARGGMQPCDQYQLDRKVWESLKNWRRPTLDQDEPVQESTL
jgi:RimJ/RimL family protein N-acetyltransferase